MTYRIQGLDPEPFRHLFDASESVLETALATLVSATSGTGFPCRVSLEDAAAGENLLLVHHVSNDVAKPFRMAHAIYVRQGARQSAIFEDVVPEMLHRRTLGLRGFDNHGMMIEARLAQPGTADGEIRAVLANRAVAYVHAHNAAYGCFLAAVERD